MADIVLLDAGPLGMLAHPQPRTDIIYWLGGLIADSKTVLVPEVADYEVRRELLRAGRKKGIHRLDSLKSALGYLPITTEAMLKAAEFWANARKRGLPTAHHNSLDADAILAGQAATYSTKSVIVASTNPRHIARFVAADNWENV